MARNASRRASGVTVASDRRAISTSASAPLDTAVARAEQGVVRLLQGLADDRALVGVQHGPKPVATVTVEALGQAVRLPALLLRQGRRRSGGAAACGAAATPSPTGRTQRPHPRSAPGCGRRPPRPGPSRAHRTGTPPRVSGSSTRPPSDRYQLTGAVWRAPGVPRHPLLAGEDPRPLPATRGERGRHELDQPTVGGVQLGTHPDQPRLDLRLIHAGEPRQGVCHGSRARAPAPSTQARHADQSRLATLARAPRQTGSGPQRHSGRLARLGFTRGASSGIFG